MCGAVDCKLSGEQLARLISYHLHNRAYSTQRETGKEAKFGAAFDAADELAPAAAVFLLYRNVLAG